ncbi:MAG: hypothetical protein ACRC78_00760 [Planktothrix sp.]
MELIYYTGSGIKQPEALSLFSSIPYSLLPITYSPLFPITYYLLPITYFYDLIQSWW